MKWNKFLLILICALIVSISGTAKSQLQPPVLSLVIKNSWIDLSWTQVQGASGYILSYAPIPYTGIDSIVTVDMGTQTGLSGDLWPGDAYYAAIQSRDGSGVSPYSNIVEIVIEGIDCKYSTLATTGFASILTECAFNRIYRGSGTNTYDTAYGDNPSQPKNTIKDPSPYTYYSYANLESAYNTLFAKYPDNSPFSSGDYFNDMRELSAFLANINQETNGASPPRFNQNGTMLPTDPTSGTKNGGAGSLGSGYGLTATSEGSCKYGSGCPDYGTKASYCTGSKPSAGDVAICKDSTSGYCPPALSFCAEPPYPDPTNPSNQYFGRGAKQLTYAYNYIFYGSKITPDDPLILANNPSILGTDGLLGWATALAYWSISFEEANGVVKPSMHDGFFNSTTGSRADEFNKSTGFGKTVNIINGGVECGRTNTFVKTTTLNRINSYIELLFLTNSDVPIDKVEVERIVYGIPAIDTYSRDDLLHNVLTAGVSIGGATVDPASKTASQLVKFYHQGESEFLSNYQPYQPSWAYNPEWSVYGRYNSAPLIQEYYFAADTPDTKDSSGKFIGNDYNNGHTNITKIMLYYDVTSQFNTTKIASERLDCSGVPNYEGN